MKKMTATVLILMTLVPAMMLSCSGNEGQTTGAIDEQNTDGYTILSEERGDEYFEKEIEPRIQYPFFTHVIIEKGYTIFPREAAHFKVRQDDTGRLADVTAIPCSIPGNDESVAMIYYVSDGGDFIVSCAEYYKSEDYEIPHVLDDDVFQLMSAIDPRGLDGLAVNDTEDASTQFWNCLVKRFTAGCLGCAVKCYITGPGWVTCTSSCCAGGFVVAVVSCAFTVWSW